MVPSRQLFHARRSLHKSTAWHGARFSLVLGAAGLSACGSYDYRLGAGSGGSSGAAGSAGNGGFAGTSGAAAGTGEGGSGGSATAGTGTGGAGPLPGLVGWASVAACGGRGTTGGAGAPTVRPADASELDDAVRAEGPSTIEISGIIELGDTTLQISSDKTLVGVDGAEIRGAARVVRARNVIIRNIKFNGGTTVGSTDALEVRSSTCIWIDHSEFFDGADGNLDMVEGTDLVTVSWSKFYYSSTSNPHRLSNILGGADTDTPGKLNVTFHHNWWGDDVLEEMPRVRHGQVHVFNNYYNPSGNSYCIGAGWMSRLLVENNVFDGADDPITFQYDEEVEGSGVHTAEVRESGNDYTNATGGHVSLGDAFTPPYPYTLDATETVRTSVTADAGAR